MKKTVLSIIFFSVLICLGILLGIFLTNKNSTLESLIKLSCNENEYVFVTNYRGTVLASNDDDKYDGRKIAEISRELSKTVLEESHNATIIFEISIFCEDVDFAENIKTSISKKLEQTFKNSNSNAQISTNIFAQKTNLQQKYAWCEEELQISTTQFEQKTETEILEIIKENIKKS